MNGVNFLSSAFRPIAERLTAPSPIRPDDTRLQTFSDALTSSAPPTRLHKNWFKLCDELDGSPAKITPSIITRTKKIAAMLEKSGKTEGSARDVIVTLVNSKDVQDTLSLSTDETVAYKAALDLVQRMMQGLYGQHLTQKLPDFTKSPLLLHTTLLRMVLIDQLTQETSNVSRIDWFQGVPVPDVNELKQGLNDYFTKMQRRYHLPRAVCLSHLLSGGFVTDKTLEGKMQKIVNAAKYSQRDHQALFKKIMAFTGQISDAQIGKLSTYTFSEDAKTAFEVACRASESARVRLVSALLQDLLTQKKKDLACELFDSLIGGQQELYDSCLGSFVLALHDVGEMDAAYEYVVLNTDKQGTQFFDIAKPLIAALAKKRLTGQNGTDIQTLIEQMPYIGQRADAFECCFNEFLFAKERENDFERNFATCQQFLTRFKDEDLKRLGLGSLHLVPLFNSLIATKYTGKTDEFQKRVERFENETDPAIRKSLLKRVSEKLLQDEEASDEDVRRVNMLASALKEPAARDYLSKEVETHRSSKKDIEVKSTARPTAIPTTSPIESRSGPSSGIGRVVSSIIEVFSRKKSK